MRLPRRPTLQRFAVLLAPVALSAPLAGCLNPSSTLIGAGPDPLPDLARQPTGGAAPSGTAASAATAPSLTDLSRAHWPALVIYQPRGQVETSFFGTLEPSWAVQRGPGTLGPGER